MDFRQYQYVLKVAELRNITRAAAELFVTQSSLSHYIARVEEELGTAIFNRTTTPISLTPAGETYVETARMIMQLDYRMRQTVTDIANEKRGRIHVGVSHARASFFLPYILPEFKRQYPGIDIVTNELRADRIVDRVLRGECDLGIIPFPLPRPEEKLEEEELGRERLLLISSRPLDAVTGEDGRQYVDIRRYAMEPFVLLKKGHGIRTALDVYFTQHAVSPPRVFETTSNETAYRLATVGMGLAIVPESTVIVSHASGPHYEYDLQEDGFYWTIGVIYLAREMLSGAEEDFIELMKANFYCGFHEKERG